MDKKEQWANKVIQSLDGMQKAEPSADLFAKITAQLSTEKVDNIIPLHRLSLVAAVACIFIVANIYIFNNNIKNKQENIYSQTTETTLLSNYLIYN